MKLFVVIFCVATSLLAVECQITFKFGMPPPGGTRRPIYEQYPVESVEVDAHLPLVGDNKVVVTLPAVRPVLPSQINALLDLLFPNTTGSYPTGSPFFCNAVSLEDCRVYASNYPANQGLNSNFTCEAFLNIQSPLSFAEAQALESARLLGERIISIPSDAGLILVK